MKKIIAIFLLSAITLHTFSKVILVLNFAINRTEIANKYCENKAKPKLHCDGKCHLKKQLKEEDKKEEKSGTGESKEKYESYFFVQLSYSFPIQNPTFKTQHSYSPNHSHSHSHAVFSPPKC